ncbi:nuclear pore complex protein Nup160 homolog [Saccoglossus kowalevskii]|uniref:Nuclear pore complex protein Nup160 homolog n=1 Tax=Saccoglossus kowalevskii TaxID=10224 RepID=A0ABM0LVJ1_SACKO|nr:PREDICTED: nuclear pore complex protein Nup160 homolog [Saccoglossus kowalevskii]
MAEPSSYIEVPLSNLELLRWKELTVHTEAPQSVLKDIKVVESAGGYGYKDSAKINTPSSNRFIYWHNNQDVIELIELSLDQIYLAMLCVYSFLTHKFCLESQYMRAVPM